MTTVAKFQNLPRWSAALFALVFVVSTVFSQRVSVIEPQKNEISSKAAVQLRERLARRFKLLDPDLSSSAFSSFRFAEPFNLSTEQSRNAAAAVGCDYLIMIRGETLRRSSFELKDHFESFAGVFVISARTGNLVDWRLVSGKAVSAEDSVKLLVENIRAESDSIAASLLNTEETHDSNISHNGFPEFSSFEDQTTKPPLPYKRISPKYSSQAFLYSIEATVDIFADIDENGKVVRTAIDRWAGFGLDEAVDRAVREMNWRPGSRSGKQLPMRILLRYNFKKPSSGEN